MRSSAASRCLHGARWAGALLRVPPALPLMRNKPLPCRSPLRLGLTAPSALPQLEILHLMSTEEGAKRYFLDTAAADPGLLEARFLSLYFLRAALSRVEEWPSLSILVRPPLLTPWPCRRCPPGASFAWCLQSAFSTRCDQKLPVSARSLLPCLAGGWCCCTRRSAPAGAG